ncbi:sulfite exporter TauE/SafE family protein [Thiohalomonas denitrificans]|uniref:Probable membrane transporter protein n=1 Tax=Thiohalomonas denitrificans TaxID=415747 RepID=A0A1G5PR17_9GAMM|nr:sulfite exporter TauE/SafE family protein [Thiohalomonas denitrificans]SCZ51882.1 hypothetical protein SAMN03097708_00612 [Thiohalomonas denitrificans]
MLDALSATELAYAAAVLFAAYFVRGITGFGSALIAVPLLALVLPVPFVVPIIVLLDYVGSVSHSVRHFHHIRWSDLLPLLPFTLTGILAALFLLRELDPGLLSKALGGFVILYAVYSLLPLPPLRGSRLWAAPLGALAGLIGTLFGTGGPFTVIYLGLRGLGKTAFRGTVATIFVMDGGMRLTGFTVTGLYSADNLLITALGVPLLAAGMYAGGRIHTNLSRQAFVRLVALILLGSGTVLLLK